MLYIIQYNGLIAYIFCDNEFLYYIIAWTNWSIIVWVIIKCYNITTEDNSVYYRNSEMITGRKVDENRQYRLQKGCF